MSNFFDEQDRTRVYDEAYFSCVEEVNPRRTPLIKTREKGPFPDGNLEVFMSPAATFQRAFRTNRIDPYPLEILKRVDRPTTAVTEDEIPRLDERESGFSRALRGDWGACLSHERHRFVAKHPLSGALVQMQSTLSDIVDGMAAAQQAPGSQDPARMARHIKETAYFLRADQVGICELPPYAVYSHSMATCEPVELEHKYAIAILIDQDLCNGRCATFHLPENLRSGGMK